MSSRSQPRPKIRRIAVIFAAAFIATSCSEKSASDRKKDPNTSEARREAAGKSEAKIAEDGEELQPDEDQIAQDCVAFVRSTKISPAQTASGDCPGCSVARSEVFAFRGMQTNSVSCSEDSCSVLVTIRAVFLSGSGKAISGGLTAWIPPETRSEYLRGQVPSGEQTYRVQITYKRRGAAWQAIEFDRPG